VLDGLLTESGVPTASIKVEEVKKVPVRFQLLMSGKIRAAALPEPFLSLAEQGGAQIVADDTKAKANLSQTILAFSGAYQAKPGAAQTIAAVLSAWDLAVADIDEAPDSYRALLVEKAKLPKSLESSYKVNTYPKHEAPATQDIEAVLAWMSAKGYLKGTVTASQLLAQTK
jgi:NitT/TauT family transport system substrate-binding protein